MRDEDADIDTTAGAAAAAAAGGVGGVCNVDDDVLLKAARSRRVARPSPATYLTADAGKISFSAVPVVNNIILITFMSEKFPVLRSGNAEKFAESCEETGGVALQKNMWLELPQWSQNQELQDVVLKGVFLCLRPT